MPVRILIVLNSDSLTFHRGWRRTNKRSRGLSSNTAGKSCKPWVTLHVLLAKLQCRERSILLSNKARSEFFPGYSASVTSLPPLWQITESIGKLLQEQSIKHSSLGMHGVFRKWKLVSFIVPNMYAWLFSFYSNIVYKSHENWIDNFENAIK